MKKILKNLALIALLGISASCGPNIASKNSQEDTVTKITNSYATPSTKHKSAFAIVVLPNPENPRGYDDVRGEVPRGFCIEVPYDSTNAISPEQAKIALGSINGKYQYRVLSDKEAEQKGLLRKIR